MEGGPVHRELANGSDIWLFDTDGDGTNDACEVETAGTSPLLPDTDFDGQSDPSELAAGTGAADPGSVFRTTDLTANGDGSFTLRWDGKAGKSYRIHRTSQLGTYNFDTIATGLPGLDGQMSHTDTPPAGSIRCFYWVEVE